MFGRESPSDKIETVIGPNATFEGKLKAEGGIRVDGTLDGSIETSADVVIGEGAQVTADVSARNVTVAGKVRGDVETSGRLEVLSSGQVWGDIAVASFVIDEGGTFQGQSKMPGEREAAPTREQRVPTRRRLEKADNGTKADDEDEGDEEDEE